MVFLKQASRVILANRLAPKIGSLTSRVGAHAPRFFSTKYTEAHEYVKVEGKVGTIGITDFAQNQLGDVVYVDLPSVGDSFEKGDAFGSVESVKAASDVYMPVGGEVIEVNEQLENTPDLVNQAAMTEGWFVKVNLDQEDDLEDLLDDAAYKTFCENEEH